VPVDNDRAHCAVLVRTMSRLRRRHEPTPRRALRRLLWLAVIVVSLSILPVLLLRWLDPPTSMVMLARRAETREQPAFRLDYRWRDWQRLSPRLPIALVAAEDQQFPVHRGFDLDAISRALDHNERGGNVRGASTISQQVAKNLFLWQGRSWLRKGMEAWYTLWIEALWPKRRILEVYANIVEFGDGVYGVEAAARRFFGVSAQALDGAQSARLAAVLPSPRRWRADRPGPYVLARQAWVERQVRQLGGPDYLGECCGVPGRPQARAGSAARADSH
jgi:monofunctional biosynthetic peptidoglycan transglycosylase